MKRSCKKVLGLMLTGFYSAFYAVLSFADGTDILADPTKNLFATFVGTGINLLLLTEIVTAGYVFSTKERKLSTWVGLPIIILVTAYAKTKFGG